MPKSWPLMALITIYAFFMGACSTSRLQVKSATDNAAVFVNDSAAGLAPWNGTVAAGKAHIVLEKNGVKLMDSAFTAGYTRQIIGNTLTFGGAGVAVLGLWQGNLPLAMGGFAAEVAPILFVPGLLRYDHALTGPLGTPPPPSEEFFSVAGPMALQTHRSVSTEIDTVFQTDSLCYEPARKAIWIYDNARKTRRPLALAATHGCRPGTPVEKHKQSLWPFLGLSVATMVPMGASLAAVYPNFESSSSRSDGDLGERATTGAIIGAVAGVAYGLLFWGMSPMHVQCDDLIPQDQFEKWLATHPCGNVESSEANGL